MCVLTEGSWERGTLLAKPDLEEYEARAIAAILLP